QDELVRQLQRLDDQRRIELLRQLQDASTKAGALRARLQGVAEKLRHTSARAQAGSGQEATPEIAIIRKGEKGPERIETNEDFELQPGDVVEVVFRMDYAAGVSPAPQPALQTGTTPAETATSEPASSTIAPDEPAEPKNPRTHRRVEGREGVR